MATGRPPGCFVEVGVYQGGSASVLYKIAQREGRALYLYDSFTGMPVHDEGDSHQLGDFADCYVERIRETMPEAILVPGIFPATLVPMPPIAFVHADADQYRSTRDICEQLGPLMVPGSAMLFDDYRQIKACIRAVDECFPQRRILENDERALVTF